MPAFKKRQLLAIINEKHPPTIGSLKTSLAQMNVDVTDEELVAMIRELSADGMLSVDMAPDSRLETASFSDYLTDFRRSGWMYLSLTVALTETILVESYSPSPFLRAVRLVLGFGLLGLIPGYSIVTLVLPRANLVLLERLILSVFLSLLVSILTGVALGAVDSFEATSNVLLLVVITFGMSILAAYRSWMSSSLS